MATSPLATLRRFAQVDGVDYLFDASLAADFAVQAAASRVTILPRASAPRRRTLRPAATFAVPTPAGEHLELNISMSRVVFEAGDDAPRTYTPFTRDAARRLVALFLGPERDPGDDPPYYNAVAAHFLRTVAGDGAAAPHGPAPAGFADQGAAQSRAARFAHLHQHAHGWFHLVEMQLLDFAVRSAVQRGGAVVEIGTYQGRSTAVMAAALGDLGVDAPLLSIDPNDIAPQQAAIAAATVAGVDPRRRLVQFQRKAVEVAPLLAEQIACLAFIDGSHAYADVADDFRICDRLLAPGGIIVFHDVYPAGHFGYEPPELGPARVIGEHVLPSGRYAPLAAAHLTFALRKLA